MYSIYEPEPKETPEHQTHPRKYSSRSYREASVIFAKESAQQRMGVLKLLCLVVVACHVALGAATSSSLFVLFTAIKLFCQKKKKFTIQCKVGILFGSA